MSRVAWLVCGWLALPGGVLGQDPTAAEFYAPTAPPVADQLAADPTVVTPDRAAIFVPALSNPADEPRVLVFRNGQQVATGSSARRTVVEPGDYVVRVGSGPVPQMVAIPVTAARGETAVVAVEWGALRVEVVDEDNVPHRASYELLSSADRQPYTVGFGADTLDGERLQTTLMPPGLYRIVRPGANFRSRTDFATVLVPAGGLVHYKLVIDPASGRFRGAGVVSPQELGTATGQSPWAYRSSIGVSIPIGSTRNVIGASNQTAVATDLFFDTYLTFTTDEHFASGLLELEEGFVKLYPQEGRPIPLQKTRDRIRFDVLYARFLAPRAGPYVRFGLLTNAFAAKVLATEDTIFRRVRSDGSTSLETVAANRTFSTGGAFAPVLLREGAGVNTRLLRSRSSFVDWRVGVGLRQNRINGAFARDDDPATPEIEYRERASFNQAGLETTLVGTTRLGVFLLNSNLDIFADFRDFDRPSTEPAIDWRNTVSWRLTRQLSLDFTMNLLRLPRLSRVNQITQNVLLRLSWGT